MAKHFDSESFIFEIQKYLIEEIKGLNYTYILCIYRFGQVIQIIFKILYLHIFV